MKAVKLQKMLGVEDRSVVAYGHTHNKESLFWLFKGRALFRIKVNGCGEVLEFWSTEDVVARPYNTFSNNVKQVYEECTHPVLLELLRTFSNTPFTSGGRGGSIEDNLRELTAEVKDLLSQGKQTVRYEFT